jgi:hypothetical protein
VNGQPDRASPTPRSKYLRWRRILWRHSA